MSAIFKPDITRTPAPDWDDDRLMAEIGRGNQQAAQILIDRHLSYVLKICTSKLGNGQDGEDAAQDVFASVWKNAAHWQSGRAKVTTWLYRIAVNRCIDILRKKRPQSGLDEIAEPEDDAENAEALMQAADRNRIIRSALAALSDDQQRAIELVYYREIGQREAAEIMGISLAALESVLRRGRQRLHEKLAAMRADLQAV
ncbi:MAG: sigma-70 family RNA polymerase sigma factor [Parvibaculales bacterium]